jgi:hypothetical protein
MFVESEVRSTKYEVRRTGYRGRRTKDEERRMAAARSFTDLVVWQQARQWPKDLFQRTQQRPFAGDQRLCVQIKGVRGEG